MSPDWWSPETIAGAVPIRIPRDSGYARHEAST